MFEKEKEAFEELNRRLRQKEMNLTVICAGGYVLSRQILSQLGTVTN